MVSFRDPIHGDLVFDGIIEELILTEEFQRLAEVKQLGLTDKVYPGANHTRFSHALGVCYLAGEMARRLGVSQQDKTLLQVAALLHDVGHYDFSHALETLAPYDHEENGKRIILGTAKLPGRLSGQIAAVLRKHDIPPERIVALLHKTGEFPEFYYSILSSPLIDADRMDYLKRDTYYTGAVIGEIDVARLLSVLVVHPKTRQLGIMHKGVASLEQFLVARMHMYQQVYLHPDSAAGEAMLRKAVAASKRVAAPFLYGDGHLLARIAEQGSPLSKRLVTRIRAGKRAFLSPAIIVDEVGSAKHLLARIAQVYADEIANPGSTERAILKLSKLKDGDVLVAFPSAHRPMKSVLPKFPVLLSEGGWVDFFAVAPIAKSAMQEQVSKTAFVVYAASEHAEQVRAAAVKFLVG